MLYLDNRFPMENKKSIMLPDDVIVMPIQGTDNTSILHSKSTGKWYVRKSLDPIVTIDKEELFFELLYMGSWIELANCGFFVPSHENAPFFFGKEYSNKYFHGSVKYIPIWGTVETGKFFFTDDGYEIKETKEVYKIIQFGKPIGDFDFYSCPMQYNQFTSFEVLDFNSNLCDCVQMLEIITGKTF